jgi:hypothetical protein
MSLGNTCLSCGAPLGRGATKCRCGWTATSSGDLQKHVDCCFVGCSKSGIVRVFTATGWANVCTLHYPEVKQVPRVCRNLHCEEIRAAFDGPIPPLSKDAEKKAA